MKVELDKEKKLNLKLQLELQKNDLKVKEEGNQIGIEVINRIHNERFKQFVYYH